MLFSSPLIAIVWIVVIVMALSFHEFAHAFVGHKKGDATAERAGRLTLNPAAHIDPFGFLFLLAFGFGWAKPVPFNPYNLKNPKLDALHIALAGPGSNLVLAAIAGILYQILAALGLLSGLLPLFLVLMVLINLFLVFFNLIPIHPLDGSKILDAVLTKPEHLKILRAIEYYGPRVLMGLIFVSLLTNFNVFFFVSFPSFLTCNLLTGESCSLILSSGF
jgi:Zn-dependent protease